LIHLSSSVGDLITNFLKAPAVGHAIDQLSGWLGGLSKSMDSQEFKKSASDLVSSTGTIAKTFNVLADAMTPFKVAFEGWSKLGNLASFIGLKAQAGRDLSWSLGTTIGDWAQNTFSTQGDKLSHLGDIDRQYGLSPGTLAFLSSHTPQAWQQDGVGALHIPKSLALPGADLKNFDTSAKMAAMLFRDEQTRHGGDSQAAFSALSMGDKSFDDLVKAHPKDWQQYLSPEIKQMLQDLDQSKAAAGTDTKKYQQGSTAARGASSIGAESLFAPQGTGVTVLVINNTGGNAATALSQLGAL